MMGNRDEPNALQDHNYKKRCRMSSRWANRASQCCCNDQVQTGKRRHHAGPVDPPHKRKRTSTASAESLDQVPSPQPSASAFFGALNVVPKASAVIPPEDLPVASTVTPDPESSSASPVPNDSPLMIHNRSVEEYQRLYHEVVDDMLMYENGKPREYSLDLGRRIKERLWRRLNCPNVTETYGEDGQLNIDNISQPGEHPPHYDLDIAGEPKP